MVSPLFVIAVFLDRIDFTNRFSMLRRPQSVGVFGRDFRFIPSELIAGVMFLAMGLYIIALAATDNLAMGVGYGLDVNIFAANLVRSIQRLTQAIPESAWAGLVLAILILLTGAAFRQWKKP